MEYQEIATKYKEKSLDTSDLEKRLDEAKLLEARPRYRALDVFARSWYYSTAIADLLTIQENSRRLDFFKKNSKNITTEYFNELIERIRACMAWDTIGIKARDFSKERFENAGLQEKFSIIYELNQKYYDFLEHQKIADLRGLITDKKTELDEQTLMKIEFFRLMFGSFKSDEVKNEFFCFDEKYLNALLGFKKSKAIRLEDYMKKQKKPIVFDYEKFEAFFSTEDYKDIIDKILLASQTTKMTKTEVMRIFSQMSESEAEQSQLTLERKAFEELEEKCYKMDNVSIESEKQRRAKEARERQIKLEEERRKAQEELEQRRVAEEKRILEEKQKAERDRIIGNSEGYTEELDKRIDTIQNTPTAKETVIPFILIWFDKEDITLTRILGAQKLEAFLDKIKKIENATRARVSLFLITNADQEVTKKRVEEIRQKAKGAGLPRLVEGAFGGYSSFRVDELGNIRELSKMSPENREKIKLLLEHSMRYSLPVSWIDENEQNYLRYKFSDEPDKSITIPYLNVFVSNLLKDKNIKKQPLRFNPFIERRASGIDVLLESQVKGITKIHEYYDSKYHIIPGRSYKVDIEKIDEFLAQKDVPVPESR